MNYTPAALGNGTLIIGAGLCSIGKYEKKPIVL